jgi:hypothetical protein
MKSSPQRGVGPWNGIFLALGQSLVFLGSCMWWVLRELELLMPSHRDLPSLSVETALRTIQPWRLAGFAAALLLCHALLGLVAFALARLVEAAFPAGTVVRRGWLITVWLVLLVAIVIAANSTWNPASIFADEESWWRQQILGVYPLSILLAAFVAAVAWFAWRAAATCRLRVPRNAALIAVAATLLVAAGTLLPRAFSSSSGAVAAELPHIVILGIDSLRADLAVPRLGEASMPEIRAFLAHSRRFRDATTPLARTYPAWVSILTGRHPQATNARFNLMPRHLVREGETLGDALRGSGYRAIYATDEVRFANFDETFGFDQMIMPPVGAVDFALGFGGDMPLVNLVAQTAAGRWLFPANHANRAAYVTYEPKQFLKRLDRELAIEGPTFLATHLTLAHWPYAWAGMSVPTRPVDYRVTYGKALSEVDRQFRAVLDLLASKGVLENAIVVVLSDHGEALGADNDSMMRKTGSAADIWDSLWGHGTSVLSPNQYRVLLAMRAYGRARLPGAPGDYDWPVSLEDLRPTLEQLATDRVAAGLDGTSLLPFLADPSSAPRLASRVRFTETDFNTPSTLAGKYQASGIVREAAAFYELDHNSGWVQLREAWLPELVDRKQRAALSKDSLLAYVPDPRGSDWRYLFTSREEPLPRPLETLPDPLRDPMAAQLWDALQARFPGELPGLPPGP